MADVYTRRLVGPTQPGTAATILLTVPAGRIYVVTDVSFVTNHATSAQTWVLYVLAGGVVTEWRRKVVAAQDTYDWSGRLPLVEGEQLRGLRVTTGVTGSVTVSGWDFAAP